MASYETEFLQALNMASQSASGLLRSIREPDYEEKLAMQTAKQKELMELEQGYSVDKIKLSGELAKEQQIRGIDSDQLITDKNISARAASDDKNILARATSDDKVIANQRYMQSASFGQEEKMTKLQGTIGDNRIKLQSKLTEQRDNLLQGFNVENMNLQTKNAMELASHQGVVSAQLFKDNAEVMKFIRREDVEWMLDFETKKPLEQAKIMNEEYIDPKTGVGTGKTNGEYLISYTASTQDAMKQAQFRNLLKDSKSKPVRDYIYTDMPVLNYLFEPTPSMNAYKKKSGITDMDQQLYLQNMGFVQNLGQQLTAQEALDNGHSSSTTNSLLNAASGQNAIYGNMNTSDPLVNKAIFNTQKFGAQTAIGELYNAMPLMSNVDTSKRTSDYDMPSKPTLLINNRLTSRGKNKLTQYLDEGKNRYNDIAANLLVRYQEGQEVNQGRDIKKQLKKDFKQGIIIGNQMVDAAKKVKADPGLIKGLEERSVILEKYLANI